MLKAMTNLNSYKIPSQKTLQSRKVFYDLHREEAEPIEIWLDRVESVVNRCEFPVFAKFLLIDKFICELKSNEIEMMIQSDVRRRTWSYKQMREFVLDWKKHTLQDIDINKVPENDIQTNEMIPTSIVKDESVREFSAQ